MAPQVVEQQRRTVLDRCIDLNTLPHLFALALVAETPGVCRRVAKCKDGFLYQQLGDGPPAEYAGAVDHIPLALESNAAVCDCKPAAL